MKILVPIDGSPFGQLAIDFIASRARSALQLPDVEVMHVQAPLPPMATRAVGRDVARTYHATTADKVIAPAARALEDAGVRVGRHNAVGVPANRIAERAAKLAVDLIVMGSHGRSALKELVLGSVAQATVALAKTPVLIVRGKAPRAGVNLRVGVAVDRSKAARAALAAVLDNDLLLGSLGALTLIVVQPPAQVFMDPLLGLAVPAAPGPDPKAAEEILAPLRKMAIKADITPREVVIQGWPEDELAAYAKKHLDVLALGSTGRSRLSRVFLGSVAARVAARCTVPLLLVHAP